MSSLRQLTINSALLLAVLLAPLAVAGDNSAKRQEVETLFRLTQMEKKIQEGVNSIMQRELQQNAQLQEDRKVLEDFLQKYVGGDALKDVIAAMYSCMSSTFTWCQPAERIRP